MSHDVADRHDVAVNIIYVHVLIVINFHNIQPRVVITIYVDI